MDNTAKLSVYIPEKAAPVIARWIDVYKVRLKISRRRSTKLGDYRPPQNGHMHRISVNGDLNPYAFLVTLVHEFAHLVTWNRHGPRVRAHGKEWKAVFRQMMQPFLDAGIFPGKLGEALENYMGNPAAASCTDLSLLRALRQYDPPGKAGLTVEEIPEGTLFSLQEKRVFRRGPRLRKRYRCTEMNTGRIYLFNPLAEVRPI